MSLRSVRAIPIVATAAFVVAVSAGIFIARFERARPVAPDFALTTASGQLFRLSQLHGRAVALVFGYTHCPDVCPTTLASLARAKRRLGPAGRTFEVVFVTVDPARDTPAAMHRYAALFDPAFVGLSGTLAQLDPIYAAYHVYHQALPATGSRGDYAVAHSSEITFIGPDGRIESIGDWDDSPQRLAGEVRRAIS